MTDHEILDLTAADPARGLAAAIDEHGPRLLGRLHARARAYNYGNAHVEDVYQESLLKLLDPDERTAIRARGGSILAWLTAWGYWRLADQARNTTATYDESEADLSHAAVERMEAAAASPQPNTPAITALESAWPHLSPRDKLLLSLRYGETRSEAQIAAHFAITLSAAKKALYDARRRLREEMRSAGYDPEE